jgi:hypothetical protein
MSKRTLSQWTPISIIVPVIVLAILSPLAAQSTQPASAPSKIYVPYDQLKKVLDSEKQGVFLPYEDFHRLWTAAQGAPAAVEAAPMPYLISTARFTGKVGPELAVMQLELTVDILQDGWVEVPIGLGEVAVAKAEFAAPADTKVQPLLRVVDGRYVLLTKGVGRRVLKIDFVRQLVTQPGLNVLSFRIPSAAIDTLELLIPEENMKVDVEPMLAAGTTAAEVDGKKATKFQAFLGTADSVKLSWKPRTQAAEELEPVVIADQFQHIHVAEALISYDIRFDLDIRRRGLDSFTLQLPADYRVISVDGANIAKWDLPTSQPAAPQVLSVHLFAPAKDKYALTVKMERFLKEPNVQLPLTPALIQQALRGTGLIALTHVSSRSVEFRDLKNLARVDVGRLPEDVRNQGGATAWRFISADYGATMSIAAVEPRISVTQKWALGVQADTLQLKGLLSYHVERSGLFQVSMNFPEPWEIVSVTPADVVEDHQLAGKGDARKLSILLKREMLGDFTVEVAARMPRPTPDAPVAFVLPQPDAQNLLTYSGQLWLLLSDQLKAEVDGLDQLTAIPLGRGPNPPAMNAPNQPREQQAQQQMRPQAAMRESWPAMEGLTPAMAFEFKAVNRAKPAGARFKIALKPTQVSATVSQLVNIQQGSLEQEAVIQYQVLYAPVDTFYLQIPAALVEADAQITGEGIKEKAIIKELPPDQRSQASTSPAAPPAAGADAAKFVYYKVVLQSPVIGPYTLRVNSRQPFTPAKTGQSVTITVEPILAAGKISDQSGAVAVVKADTLAILAPTFKGLTPADPGSAADLPYEPHRRSASLAFKYSAPPFELVLPVQSQAEAAVITTIASAAIVEQVLARDGTLNTHATYLLTTSRGDRVLVTLPAGAKLFAVLLNGSDAPLEAGPSSDERIVRLPPSAGQVTKAVLEISYGLDKASASHLAAPILNKSSPVPVQQTLWRLFVPAEDYVLRYDRTFSPLPDGQGQQLLNELAAGQPCALAFKQERQGNLLEFVRQGGPGELSVWIIGKEAFSVIVWLAVIVVGALMLPLGGYRRVMWLLGIALAAMIVHLWAPLLVGKAFWVGVWAMILVAAMWAAQWLFFRLPRKKKTSPPPVAVATAPSAPQGSPTSSGQQKKEGQP